MTAARRWKATARLFIVALTTVVLSAGCGQGTPALSASASRILGADVQRLQLAARAGSPAGVASAGDQLRADVAAQLAAGHVSSARATAVLDQLARVLADTAAMPSPVTTQSPSPSRGEDHGKGKGNGRDNGGGG